MKQILSISLHEIFRLRKRFSGGASPLTVVILIGVVGLSAFALRQVTVLGNGLYRVGVSGDVPAIEDSRFAVIAVDADQGQALLAQGAIDVWIDGAQAHSRSDEKSQYAIGALRRYLEKREVERVGTSYEAGLAFPLRVGINYLVPPPPASTPAAGVAPAIQPEAATQEGEIIIPSLMMPRAPFAQVVLSLVYILPVTFISIFFTSSFMDEKLNRRLTILLSAPVTPFQIITGKMLPYAIFALAATTIIAGATHANIPLALAIFAPTTLFIFAIYLMVPLFYRTYKDTTFISMLVTTLTTAFLVTPAMFNGVSDLAYMSPLTLAVQMYRGQPFGWREYLFPSLPMVAIFGLAMYAGTRLLNEEFLMGYRPITLKVKDAIFLVMDRAHPYRSVGLLSFLLIPVIYLVQLVILAIASNLPPSFMLLSMLLAAALVEEIVKSIGIVVWIEHGIVSSTRQVLALAFLSALGFLLGEKLLLLFSISLVSQSALSGALFNTGFLLLPLLAHFVFTAMISLLRARTRLPYGLVLIAGTLLHSLYNWFLMRGLW
jgi:ABC-type Na+ efflux pump permease subunit